MAVQLLRCGMPLPALGVVAVLCATAWMIAPAPSEFRDWLFYGLLLLVAPAVEIGSNRQRTRQGTHLFLGGIIGLWAVLIVGANAFALRPMIERGIPSPTGALTVSAVLAIANAWLCFVLSSGIYRACVPAPNRTLSEKLAAFAFTFAILRPIDFDSAVLFWFQIRVGTGLIVLIGTLFYFHRYLLREPSRLARSRWLDVFWIVIFLLWSRVPYTGVSGVLLHHWSFYLGPIQGVQRGGLLLHDIPSQYGFLSILFPAWLPLAPADAFLLGVSLAIFAAALATYRTLVVFPLLKGDRLAAGALTFACLYLVADGRSDALGVIAVPSASVYRYLWAYGLVLTLGARRETLSLGVTIAFALGCLWSSESAVYCGLILGAAAVGEALARGIGGEAPTRVLARIARGYASPILGAGGAFALVEFVYRFRYGIAPDWYAYGEYALAYRAGIVSAPIAISFLGNATTLFAFLALGCALAAEWIRRGNPANARATAAVWAYFASTMTYFVSRSDPNTPAKLLALWFPLLCGGVGLLDHQARKWTPFVLAAALLIVVAAFGDFPRLGKRFVQVASAHPLRSIEPLLDSDPRAETGKRIRELLKRDELVLDLAGPFSEVALNLYPFETLAPATPPAEFIILAPRRREEYLRRYLARRGKHVVQLVKPLAPGEADALGEVLGRLLPQREVVARGSDFVIERFEAMAGEIKSSNFSSARRSYGLGNN